MSGDTMPSAVWTIPLDFDVGGFSEKFRLIGGLSRPGEGGARLDGEGGMDFVVSRRMADTR